MIPTITEARTLLKKYNSEPHLIRHGETVSGVMGYFAKQNDSENEEFWRVVGMLHDIDFEQFPEEHCVKGIELLQENGVDETVIRSAISHGWGITKSPYEPQNYMEKILYATDELTGLIGATAIMRPSKSCMDLELSSVKKKFKDKKFAAGCSRDVIRHGAEMLGMELDLLIQETILAMREVEQNSEKS
ncbi:MAG: HDIG domain-containing protein [Defluviitaleaceae bacterium]|nr:HDIG domain-containing protein [Defluviitaleaceae bacterium]